MKKIQMFCDACGKEIQLPSNFSGARLEFKISIWDNGSINADLCSECAHKLQKFIEDELNIEPLYQ